MGSDHVALGRIGLIRRELQGHVQQLQSAWCVCAAVLNRASYRRPGNWYCLLQILQGLCQPWRIYSHREVTGLEEEARRRKEEKEQEDAIFKTCHFQNTDNNSAVRCTIKS